MLKFFNFRGFSEMYSIFLSFKFIYPIMGVLGGYLGYVFPFSIATIITLLAKPIFTIIKAKIIGGSFNLFNEGIHLLTNVLIFLVFNQLIFRQIFI